MNFAWMLLAFILMSGIAVGLCRLWKVNIGEGMLLSASAIILIMFLAGLAGNFSYGIYAIGVLGAGGWLCSIFLKKDGGRMLVVGLLSPSFIILLLLLIYGLIFFYHDFIQHVDEFHQWAAAVKYMWEYDRFPIYSDFIGGRQPFATSLFHLFFQEITGYNEQNMYISALLLMWIGFLLPVSTYSKKEWKRVTLYTLILYFAIYSLYYYGPKNLYVDLPTIAWAGGLAGWWMNRRKKKVNGVILAAGIVMIYFFKSFVGLLLGVFVLAFVIAHRLFLEKKIQDFPLCRKKTTIFFAIVGCLGILSITGSAIFIAHIDEMAASLPRALQERIALFQVTGEKAFETLNALVSNIVGSALSANSNLKISLLLLFALVLIIFMVSGELLKNKQESKFCMIYSTVVILGYCLVLYFAYLFMFTYEESIKAAGGLRYFAIIGMYLFILALVSLFKREITVHRRLRKYFAAGLLFFFLYGLNGNYITDTTALNKDGVGGYTDISETRQQGEQILSIIEENDKVYFITQEQRNEFPANAALYYLEQQVSNYLTTPWKFTASGSVTRLAETEAPTIEDFPTLLRQGGYTYVWIYKTDAYLTEKLPEVIKCEKVRDGGLYQVIYKDGVAIKLKFVKDLSVKKES